MGETVFEINAGAAAFRQGPAVVCAGRRQTDALGRASVATLPAMLRVRVYLDARVSAWRCPLRACTCPADARSARRTGSPTVAAMIGRCVEVETSRCPAGLAGERQPGSPGLDTRDRIGGKLSPDWHRIPTRGRWSQLRDKERCRGVTFDHEHLPWTCPRRDTDEHRRQLVDREVQARRGDLRVMAARGRTQRFYDRGSHALCRRFAVGRSDVETGRVGFDFRRGAVLCRRIATGTCCAGRRRRGVVLRGATRGRHGERTHTRPDAE